MTKYLYFLHQITDKVYVNIYFLFEKKKKVKGGRIFLLEIFLGNYFGNVMNIDKKNDFLKIVTSY